jgi:hypothetical protein
VFTVLVVEAGPRSMLLRLMELVGRVVQDS